MVIRLFLSLVKVWRSLVEFGSRKSQEGKLRWCLSVTSATALAFGRCSARPSFLGEFGYACSAAAPS